MTKRKKGLHSTILGLLVVFIVVGAKWGDDILNFLGWLGFIVTIAILFTLLCWGIWYFFFRDEDEGGA